MKVVSLFLISLCGFYILFSSTLTISEARPLPQLPLNSEKWGNWLMEEMKIEPVGRPTPVQPPPSPNRNPPSGPSISSSSSDHNTASA
ncbi:hypothetical protein PIB30_004611 [Stylosanthes scabra]|uniref:Transmembrane protein n=1 Tax=Stylosanthes scabra TaxID=79078 RepID=A0ABU6Z2G3_9FABA|nr:hypothetical protein [Stylosanthes scabra]